MVRVSVVGGLTQISRMAMVGPCREHFVIIYLFIRCCQQKIFYLLTLLTSIAQNHIYGNFKIHTAGICISGTTYRRKSVLYSIIKRKSTFLGFIYVSRP